MCTGTNLWVHFKKIARHVVKWYAVEKQIKLASGEDKQMLTQRRYDVFQDRYNKPFKFLQCADYLRGYSLPK
jgi:hypothetical protein